MNSKEEILDAYKRGNKRGWIFGAIIIGLLAGYTLGILTAAVLQFVASAFAR